MLESLTLDSFAPHLGESFRIRVDDERAVDVELVEARRLGGSASKRREPFALLFKGPATPILPQRIYQFEHEIFGHHEIFIVPVGPGEGGLLYEAIFT